MDQLCIHAFDSNINLKYKGFSDSTTSSKNHYFLTLSNNGKRLFVIVDNMEKGSSNESVNRNLRYLRSFARESTPRLSFYFVLPFV